MKHLLNDMTEAEKNAIREQHEGGMKVMTEKFSKLVESKLGDVPPIISEQGVTAIPQSPKTSSQQNQSKVSQSINQNSQEWFKNFPCVAKLRFDGNNYYTKEGAVLLPQSGRDDKGYQSSLIHKPLNGAVGQVKNGGVYFCDSTVNSVLIVLS